MADIISRLADPPPGKQRLLALKLKADAVVASGAARPPAPEPAGVHGAGGVRRAGAASADRERQAGPQGAAVFDEAILLELGEMSDEEAESALAGVGGPLDPVTEDVR
jgi:hypothetical protein